MLSAREIVAAIKESPLTDDESAWIMTCLVKKQMAESLIGSGMDMLQHLGEPGHSPEFDMSGFQEDLDQDGH
jgi:hypothetical protein